MLLGRLMGPQVVALLLLLFAAGTATGSRTLSFAAFEPMSGTVDIEAINQEGTGREVLQPAYVRSMQELADRQGGSTVRRFDWIRTQSRLFLNTKVFPGLEKVSLVIDERVRPTRSQHSSSIAEVAPGVLLAAWFGGTWERMGDVGIWTARYMDGRWGPPQQVAWPQEDWRNPGWMAPCWNPVLLHLAGKNETLLMYKVGTNPEVWRGFMMRSYDGGLSWSEPRRMGENIIGPTKGVPYVFDDGTILAGSSDEDGGWTVHLELSRDGGETWERYGEELDYGRGIIQPSIFRTSDGKMQMVMRTRRAGRVAETESDNNGWSWDQVSLDRLQSPNAGLYAITLRDGRVALAHNFGSDGRNKLALSLSYDNAGTYETVAMLQEDEQSYPRMDECVDPRDRDETDRAEYSYPYLLQTSDGMLHVTFTYSYFGSGGRCTGRENIKHVVIDPCKLGDPSKIPPTCPEPDPSIAARLATRGLPATAASMSIGVVDESAWASPSSSS
uniref:Bnr asp-box repeat domain-containing protein n=1 Tax=Tetraselmis sp. GSL018 TaxID=582737 RepID=A0A061RU72_9CHLO|mmetsp:Transcript_34891/g.82754  ORF Transcript_34891/g.82754 Transcript_34891/m.82754 type:complete len:499 (-) Transcript_34891:85-1581(-)|eukprot:CAMPEP_0177619528 /NCGR_PEP_ID=MMETSP0419_2-20121207/26327_1 /TAXON_ID=582737 /ORGANISM="Tetraselmis sp., Strain GSL018" /LENGTH=498 /DNA_ID=CAMNT_0019118839 /DNA_START=275 /DNA_END=1771 /DNA_ORIENTATION=-